MNEYRLTGDADADLLELFLYGLETFGLAQAADYRRLRGLMGSGVRSVSRTEPSAVLLGAA